ncbi:MAG TPA: bifunctional precorrin-2 dehydrogenase/sirohydrochlorin ferrochelatase [Geomonas sp.]
MALGDSGQKFETEGYLRYYPVNLDLNGRCVVLVGGGAVAARKALRLVEAGARLTVVAPLAEDRIAALAAAGSLVHLKRCYLPGDLEGALLAFAATDDATVNLAVAAEAKERGILIDVVDAPREGDFTTPAVLSRGDLLITVSTAGASPGLARRIIGELEPLFGEEYAESVTLLAAIREKILTQKGGSAYNDRVFAELAALDLPALIKNGRSDVLDQILLKLSASGPQAVPDGAEKKDPS